MDRRLRIHPPWLIMGALALAVLLAHMLTLASITLSAIRNDPPAARKVLAQAQLITPVPSTPLSTPKVPATPLSPAPDPLAASKPAPTEATPKTSPSPAEPAATQIANTELAPDADAPDVLVARQLPPPAFLEYTLEGMDRGLHYRASSTLQWQYNEQRYELSLSVQAFLLGTRQWRSSGQLGPDGLLPERLSDKRKSEVAAHFDRVNQQVIFSSNKPSAALLAGAQDQISLFVQLGGAVNTTPDRFAPGVTLNVQTVTPRSADLWRITLVSEEQLVFQGQPHLTRHWVCAPRGPYDSRLEFWTDPALTGLPVRIRITQANGSYIDMQLSDLKDAPPLPAS